MPCMHGHITHFNLTQHQLKGLDAETVEKGNIDEQEDDEND